MNWLEKHITLQNYDDRKAEMENAVTHFIGAGLSIIGFIMILFRLKEVGSTALKAGLVIFALSNILLYTASGLYHYLMPGKYFFDTDYHLSNEGAALRTEMLVRDIKRAMAEGGAR